ncbi:protein translocase subunit SecF [Candidatus Peregrinibacteria bacterium CG11_big_fil_rev_8_21_14_0_20_46_8]|nr:MAG: protein translocase subunit SecF [Candidatus Peregrinibacteria bacterium CG11_big_fil_rev_8_21_14_0_20_46_8]
MLRSNTLKVVLIIVFALGLGYFDLPSDKQTLPGTPDFFTRSKINLGLDLQGGSQLDYRIDLRKVPESDRDDIVEGVREVITRRVNNLGVAEPNIYTSKIGDEQHLIVELAGITDLDEAKEVVGKTIQLEFKEEREGDDPEVENRVRTQAQTVLERIRSGEISFEEAGSEEELNDPSRVTYQEPTWEFVSSIQGEALKEALQNREPGVVPQLIEDEGGFRVSGTELIPNTGVSIVNVMGRRLTADLPVKEKAVKVSHILVAYEGASRADESITRTKAEARTRAEELASQARSDADFAALAKENSDEPGADASGGELAAPVKEGGNYVEEFTEAALQLSEVGEISEIVETEFGFHIIRADNFDQVQYGRIFFSTLPDRWQPTQLTGEQFERADVVFSQLGQPSVQVTFNSEGAELFADITERNIDKQVAIFVGGNLISAPVVQQAIQGGVAQITGNFSVDEAQELARDLNTGAIPAPVIFSGQVTIGATLGAEALATSVKAGIIGLIILSLFMILYYRLPGVIATIALGVYTVLLLFFIKSALPTGVALILAIIIFGAIVYAITKSKDSGWEKFLSFILACFVLFFLSFIFSNAIVLTLAGVAGVILSIGMAIDANILIFERTKEELRSGRPLASAIEVGFDRAWSSIRDSNFSSLITCGILFYFGTSIIRGFAFNLAAGILISMFSAITITKTLMLAFVRTKLGHNLALWGADRKKERVPFKIVERRTLWYSISGILAVFLVVILGTFGLKFGIDFTGGSLLDVTLESSPTVQEISQTLDEVEQRLNEGRGELAPAETSDSEIAIRMPDEPINLASSRIVRSPDEPNRYIMNLVHLDNREHDAILSALEEKFGTVTENRFTTIGPVVGSTLRERAFAAVLIAIAAIILYIAFAFRRVPKNVSAWKFGFCAIVALLHDILIPIGVFSLLQFEIDALFITAVLTVMGFSVHDTIVVFDRIRENLKNKSRDETFAEVANKSLTQTMARSINTSFTTLITLSALLIFGSPSIFHFILVLVIGILVGTYSSVFIATPLLAQWQKKLHS